MRMTFKNMGEVAKDILAVYAFQISQLKNSKVRTGETQFVLEDTINERDSMASAFGVLGIVSDDEAEAIAKKRWSKKDILAIKEKPVWNCAMAKTAKPVSFNPNLK